MTRLAEHDTVVRFTRRGYGGWNVALANGRIVGWLCRNGGTGMDRDDWQVRVSCCAFRGDGPDDEGYVLDLVPGYLYNGDGLTSHPIGYDSTREYAAERLVRWLHKYRAPAVGYRPHPAVRTWAERRSS